MEELLEESLPPLENVDSGEAETSDNLPDGASNGLDKSGSRELETGKPDTGGLWWKRMMIVQMQNLI